MDTDLIASTLQVLRAMLHQEEQRYGIENYFLRPDLQKCHLKDTHPSSGAVENNVMDVDTTTRSEDELPIDPECRFRMTEWCYQLIDHCGFRRETVATAISCLDRFLASRPTDDDVFMIRARFQLAAMTCLYSVVKVHEKQAMDTELVSRLSSGLFAPKEVEVMEMEILLSIGFLVNPPTALAFCKYLLDAMPTDWMTTEMRDTVLELAKYQTEMAVGDVELIRVKPSWIALASLTNAMESIKESYPFKQLVADCISGIVGVCAHDTDFRNIRIRLYEGLSGAAPLQENRFSSQIMPQPPSCIKQYTRLESTTCYEEPTSVLGY